MRRFGMKKAVEQEVLNPRARAVPMSGDLPA